MKLIPASASRTYGRGVLKAKANSPHIFFGAGMIGLAVSTYLACRATLKLEDELDIVRAEIEEANAKANKEVVEHFAHSETLTPEILDRADMERAKEVSIVTFKGALAVGKLYAFPAILGGISIACIAGSHVQLTRRNAASAAAFTAISKAFDEYRSRVRAEVGEEKELDIYRSVEIHEIKDENGKKQLVRAVNPNGLSIYAKSFDDTNPLWKKNAEMNRTFLTMQEQYFNHLLRREGFVFLNNVYDKLGFEQTQLGQMVGWVLNSDEGGDGYIDFGMFEARNTEFMNNLDPTIWLDFNVDGKIVHLLP